MSIADAAIARMRGPRNMHIICIDVTNKCDLACSNCTRLLENQDHFWDITPENFRLALRSLKGYWGVIAMIGGNPCMHKNFAELCQIFEEEVPNKLQRGLWTNNYFKHRELCEKTFGTFNLNSHGEQRAEEGLTELATVARSTGGVAWNYSGHSDHAPLLTAVKDLYPEQEMWERIANCDINREWSASIVQNKGKLRAYFCEVAASFDLARGTDHGMPLTEGWWNKQITDFSDQVKRFCPGCGVPAKQKGNKDYEEIDTYTDSNADLAVKSLAKKNRKIIHLDATQKEEVNKRVTLYNSGQ